MTSYLLTHFTERIFYLIVIAALVLGPNVALAERTAVTEQEEPAQVQISAAYHQWSKLIDSSLQVMEYNLATDEVGNVFLAGMFSGNVDFGGGLLAGNCDAFLVKYDPYGHHLWSKNFQSIECVEAQGVATDADGNVYITGVFQDNVDFGGGVLSNAGQADAFLVKFDANGNHLWSKAFGGTEVDWGYSLGSDIEKSIFVTGYFRTSVDFGDGALISAGEEDVFLAKYDASGNYLWAKRFGSTGSDRGIDLTLDALGNVFVTGGFYESVDFGGEVLTSVGENDIFLAKYDTDGNHLWSKRIGGTSYELAWSLDTDAKGNVFSTGYFLGSVDFGGGTLDSAGSRDIFLAKYSADGDHLWSKRFGDTGYDTGTGLSTGTNGEIFLTGSFMGSVDFGGGIFTSVIPSINDIFLAGYDADGNHLWSKHFSNESDLGGFGGGGGVATDDSGSIFVTGSIKGSFDFGGGPLVSTGEIPDAFLVKFVGHGVFLPLVGRDK